MQLCTAHSMAKEPSELENRAGKRKKTTTVKKRKCMFMSCQQLGKTEGKKVSMGFPTLSNKILHWVFSLMKRVHPLLLQQAPIAPIASILTPRVTRAFLMFFGGSGAYGLAVSFDLISSAACWGRCVNADTTPRNPCRWAFLQTAE